MQNPVPQNLPSEANTLGAWPVMVCYWQHAYEEG